MAVSSPNLLACVVRAAPVAGAGLCHLAHLNLLPSSHHTKGRHPTGHKSPMTVQLVDRLRKAWRSRSAETRTRVGSQRPLPQFHAGHERLASHFQRMATPKTASSKHLRALRAPEFPHVCTQAILGSMESTPNLESRSAGPPDLTAGIPLPGISTLDGHRFLTALRIRQLPNLFLNPHIAENPALLEAMPTVRKFADRRELVQRLMRTQLRKRRNVAAYRDYILEVVKGERMGSMPPIEAWTPEFVLVSGGTAFIPWGEQLVGFDGDTQLAAWFDLIATGDEDVLDYLVPVVLHSGRSTEWAQQQLHDRNTYGVKMTASEAMERDSYDQVTAVTKDLVSTTGLRVATQKRQLGARDPEQLTLSSLRQGVLTTLAGRPGIQVGTKPYVLAEDVSLQAASAAVKATWIAILEIIRPYLSQEGRKETVLPAPAVMAGIGVVAHGNMPDGIRRPDVVGISREQLIELLESVCWSRKATLDDGSIVFPWEGIAGKANTTMQRFSVGGAKEYAYAVAEALEDPLSARGRSIRMNRSGG